MAGKKGMHHRASTSPATAAAIRARIKAGVILDRLTKHVLGKVKMAPSQVTAALGLLRKCVPDLATMEHTGEVTHQHVARLPDVEPNSEEWLRKYAPRLLPSERTEK